MAVATKAPRKAGKEALEELVKRLETPPAGGPAAEWPPRIDWGKVLEGLENPELREAVEIVEKLPVPKREEVEAAVRSRRRGVLAEIAVRNGVATYYAKDFAQTVAISVSKAVAHAIKTIMPNAKRLGAWYTGLSIGMTAAYGALRYAFDKWAKDGFSDKSPWYNLLRINRKSATALAGFAAAYFVPVVAQLPEKIRRIREKKFDERYGIEPEKLKELANPTVLTNVVKNAIAIAWTRAAGIGIPSRPQKA